MNDQGLTSVSLTNLKKLITLDLSNNYLTTININGLIYLKYIYLGYNNISDVDYDIYISADTFLSLNGTIDTTGNALPTVYSEQDRNSLKIKGWVLSPIS